ncbi:MAG TPA: N-acetyl-gamma-glutamyl-phosphate reductase [Candidatus Borkfalkia excrementigallinarum]|uniref:N-acetyl-gamma-glutamyl-phosphate reductase n=1 Tax=Candidatus Borkfalkia excrementigallinarum TaxID=2838506 RepID=A0A9D1ZV28_9FIRM|nr:N-acetyl-gamma-glutamyl-phosphate reductase [Candidatus Borkfalkia excrementigallinarum]
MVNVFIDGKEGTTGLKIFERLGDRQDICIHTLPEEFRKDADARREQINAADIVFLCLPDTAAKESVSLCENNSVKIIDASTAHRTNPEWAYGFPELSLAHRKKVESSKRVAVPGCHASGFISLVYPLIAGGIVSPEYPFVCHSVTGYSGGGKKMISEYEDKNRSAELDAPRQYGISQSHKHLPEMKAVCGLQFEPIFNPIVADYYSGMCVTLPLYGRFLTKKMSVNDLKSYFTEYYASSNFVDVSQEDTAYLSANILSGTNKMRLFVGGNDERIVLSSVFDNLGKGASGAAVQCMNIMLGLDERTGLL